jgi:hypothetical protein
MEIVLFNSPEDARKIQAYFPDTTVNDNKLVSPKFDNRALKLAIGLEKLTNYKIFNNLKPSKNNWFLNRQNQSWILEIDILVQDVTPLPLLITEKMQCPTKLRFNRHQCHFSVESHFNYAYREVTGLNEIPLVVTPKLLDFINILEKQNIYIANTPIREIESCVCQINLDNPRICRLGIVENGLKKFIRFYPTNILLYEA